MDRKGRKMRDEFWLRTLRQSGKKFGYQQIVELMKFRDGSESIAMSNDMDCLPTGVNS